MINKIAPEGGFRSESEKEAAKGYIEIFDKSQESSENKLQNFPKYIRRQDTTKFLARYEIFKRILNVKGSIVECGVYRGFGTMSWALFSAVLEPVNLTRRIYGFDTFSGFQSVSAKDKNKLRKTKPGELMADSYSELKKIIEVYDLNRYLGHIKKVELIKGDVKKTIPEFVKNNKHLVISLLFLDFDLYESTVIAIKNLYERIPKGGIIAFDELDNPIWPGETLALLESIGIEKLKIQKLDFDPYIGFAIKE